MPFPTPLPPTKDVAGANLDPRACDCGKGMACPLITKEWDLFLQDAGIDLDAWLPKEERVPAFAVIDVRDGFTWTQDDEGEPFLTKEQAERSARTRNDGVWTAAQSFRVFRLERVPFADVKPRPLGD